MPGKERCQNKEHFGPWLIRQINSNQFNGVRWLNDERTLFRLPWKHFNTKSVDERDYAIFKAWAIHSGKYNEKFEDLPVYKTNFRCALKSVCYQNRRMFSDYRNNSLDPHDPHKIFMYNGIHEDCSMALLSASNVSPAVEEENLQNDLEHDEDYRLRTSPDVLYANLFPNSEEAAVMEELMRNIYLDSPEDDLSQKQIPRVDHVFLNGHEQALAVEPSAHNTLLYDLGSHIQGYFNGYADDVPVVEQNYGYTELQPQLCRDTVTGSEAQVCQHGLQQQSTQQMVVTNDTIAHPPNCANYTDLAGYTTPPPMGHVPSSINENKSAEEMPANEHHQQGKIPKLTSWEITISYRGKEVLKRDVSKKCCITHTGHATEALDIVSFPGTDTLVSQTQIQFTDTILNSVGSGLLLEVNPDDFTLYATRLGDARVYWSMSGSLKTKDNASQSEKLERDVPTRIFNFCQFWEELKDYNCHKRSSPDYTIYLSFGQYLFEPVNKALVLVKLVPRFCTFWHQVAQEGGASSLHTEQFSLQISNGSSFNSFESSCLMDISDFSYLF